jgi:aspartyl-tRNA synthetase
MNRPRAGVKSYLMQPANLTKANIVMDDYQAIDTKRRGTHYRTDTCAQLRSVDVGRTTRLAGWIHRIRDHGNVIFLDVRDHYGITQAVISRESQAFQTAQRLRHESVVNLFGTVRPRPSGTLNADLSTGEIEVLAERIDVLSDCADLPLPVFGEPDFPEETRLKYRFIELRREKLHRNIMLRSWLSCGERCGKLVSPNFKPRTPHLIHGVALVD